MLSASHITLVSAGATARKSAVTQSPSRKADVMHRIGHVCADKTLVPDYWSARLSRLSLERRSGLNSAAQPPDRAPTER